MWSLSETRPHTLTHTITHAHTHAHTNTLARPHTRTHTRTRAHIHTQLKWFIYYYYFLKIIGMIGIFKWKIFDPN